MMPESLPKQADVDRMARNLYQHEGYCAACRQSIPLADALRFHCPHCGAVYLPGPITPERGREMLATLEARRRALGLPGKEAAIA